MTIVIAGDRVYDLIGLELGQAIGAFILLFLLLIAGDIYSSLFDNYLTYIVNQVVLLPGSGVTGLGEQILILTIMLKHIIVLQVRSLKSKESVI